MGFPEGSDLALKRGQQGAPGGGHRRLVDGRCGKHGEERAEGRDREDERGAVVLNRDTGATNPQKGRGVNLVHSEEEEEDAASQPCIYKH